MFIFINFQIFNVTYPPPTQFSIVLMLVVCLFSPKSVQFARYRRFRVLGYMCVSTKFYILFWYFEVTYPPTHFQVF
jgi:hypothetical protein